MRNARVFPDPVLAAPKTSFPASNTGIDFACTGVMVLNPISAIALLVCSESSSVENGSLASSWLFDISDAVMDAELDSAAMAIPRGVCMYKEEGYVIWKFLLLGNTRNARQK